MLARWRYAGPPDELGFSRTEDLIGKFFTKNTFAYMVLDDKEVQMNTFEVLFCYEWKWQDHRFEAPLPKNAMIIGSDKNLNNLYAGLIFMTELMTKNNETGWTIARVSGEGRILDVPWNGQIINLEGASYKLLVFSDR